MGLAYYEGMGKTPLRRPNQETNRKPGERIGSKKLFADGMCLTSKMVSILARRKRNRGALPDLLANRRNQFATTEPVRKKRDNNHSLIAFPSPRECARVRGFRPRDTEWDVRALPKKIRVLFAKLKCFPNGKQLDFTSRSIDEEFSGVGFALHRLQQLLAQHEIDRASIVGIDKAEIPEFSSLIKIRHTGRGHLQQRLRKRVKHAEMRHRRLKLLEVLQKCC